ncbi:hypothetical protein M0R45_031484 [Rubus argutus]|uniref:Serine-rich protein-like protein n=1 Tax=Rubus argutus TaxID=59490 RepID=A0AAW1WE54_RUBAR
MTVISSSSSKTRSDLEPPYRSCPLFYPSASGFASSTSFSFSAASSSIFTHHPLYGHSRSTSLSSVRFAVDRPGSPGRLISVKKQLADNGNNHESGTAVASTKKACLCSPSTHPGSFRCALHKNRSRGGASQSTGYHSSMSLNYRRSAMNNSLVRIGGVEGDLVKRALAALIRPSAHNQRRRADFQPKQSRLSIMSKAATVPDFFNF